MKACAETDGVNPVTGVQDDASASPGLRILIVDDEPIDRGVFMRYLDADRPGAFYYTEAETARDGLRKAEALRPDCILLDFNLPDMDGLSVIRLLREGRDMLPCAVVMLTGAGNEEVAVEAMKLGAMDYMAKSPASAYALPRTVTRSIERFRMQREIERQRLALERRNRELEATRAELFDEKERYRVLAETIPQLVWKTDSIGSVHYGNRRLWEFIGVPDTGPCSLESLIHDNDRAELRNKWSEAARSGCPFECELRLWRARDASWRWQLMRASPIPGEEDSAGWFGTFTDIEDRRRSEEALRRREKVDSIGLLAGGIAHDFNNLLVGIVGGASFALSSLERAHPAYSMVETILSSGERAASLTQQLLTYAGNVRGSAGPADIAQIIHDTCELVRPSIPQNIDLVIENARGIPLIETNAGDVQQIIVNLAINAAEAIGEHGGAITVRTSVKQVDPGDPALYAAALYTPGYELPAGQYVSIELSDSGPGMDDRTLSRIFDPFFTTRFIGRGLGLAVVQGLLRSLGAGIAVRSAPGSGSTFEVLLPLAEVIVDTSAANGASKPVSNAANNGVRVHGAAT